jgi:hypothetical protein
MHRDNSQTVPLSTLTRFRPHYLSAPSRLGSCLPLAGRSIVPPIRLGKVIDMPNRTDRILH